jgi:DNA (cytosine-5)-methyltransferase 1
MRHGSLFSGIGGFDLAAEWMGWENVFQVEWDSFCQKVLTNNFPNVKRYGNIKEFDGTKYRGLIDIISGGFPCQPYSMAGKRKGKEDERHLWPEMLRAIREIQPNWIVGENVPGIINWSGGLVFHEVQTDLEAEGYEVFPVILPAISVNAPHKRERIWFIASSVSRRKRELLPIIERNNAQEIGCENSCGFEKSFGSGITSDTEKQRLQIGNAKPLQDTTHRTIERHNSISGWEDFPTQSPICGRNDGISKRVDRIKSLGNAVVPQVVYQIFKAIEEIN